MSLSSHQACEPIVGVATADKEFYGLATDEGA